MTTPGANAICCVDFCQACGDCLVCHAEDPCLFSPDGRHSASPRMLSAAVAENAQGQACGGPVDIAPRVMGDGDVCVVPRGCRRVDGAGQIREAIPDRFKAGNAALPDAVTAMAREIDTLEARNRELTAAIFADRQPGNGGTCA